MKPGPAKSRRKRILLLYSLAMLIPGLALAYLAYRGVLNDQALREKQAREKMEAVSQDFFVRFDSLLNEQVKEFISPSYDLNDPDILLFFKAKGQEKEILQHHLLYLPEENIDIQALSKINSDKWEEGWELEFNKKNLDGALKFYTRIENDADNPQEQLTILNARARILKKMGKPDMAAEVFENIIQSFPNLKINGEIPAKGIALLETASIYSDANDQDKIKTALNQLTSFLMNPGVEYSKAQFNFFLNKISGYDESLNESNLNELKTRSSITDQLINFYREFGMYMSLQSGEAKQIRKYIDKEELSVVYVMLNDSSAYDYGIFIDLEGWMEHNNETLFAGLNNESDIVWEIIDNKPSSLWSNKDKSEQEWIRYKLPENLPPWTLQMAPRDTTWFAMIFQPGNRIFALIFAFIIIIMLLGLGFTIHILNQELRLNKLKTEFISNVSHELKSPLTSIRQMTEMLNDQRIDSVEQRNDYYSIMLDQSEHLSHLIDNILDFSRMEENRKLYHFENINLIPVVDKLIASFTQQTEELEFDIQYQADIREAMVRADKDAIRQVVYNLMDNAIKFSKDSKNISCGLRVASSGLEIRIRDWGIGIAKKEQDKIFERFYRSPDNVKMRIKGSGIGLTLVKSIVEAHSGRIEVESKPGEGSTFYVYLPLLKTELHEEDSAG